MKRIFDIVFSAMGLTIVSPAFLWIMHRIKSEDGGPVFYRGLRVGFHGAPFYIYKFRTMVVNADRLGPSSTSEDDPRITRIGRLLRKHKLDELPQLLNVLKTVNRFEGQTPHECLFAAQRNIYSKLLRRFDGVFLNPLHGIGRHKTSDTTIEGCAYGIDI